MDNGNGNGKSNSLSAISGAANNAQTTPASKKSTSKKNGKCHHCGKKGHWKNECRKRIAEEKAVQEGNGGTGGTAIYSAGLAFVANQAIADELINGDSGNWILDSGAN